MSPASPTPSASPADSTTRGGPRERAICSAALELLAELGFDGMSMDAVAARARASKATIYRRWSSKQDLVVDAIRSRVAPVIAPEDTGCLRGDLLAALRRGAADIGGSDVALMSGILWETRTTPELRHCMRDQMIEDKASISRTIVARAHARGELASSAVGDVLHEVAGALLLKRLVIDGEDADEAYLEHLTDDVLLPLLGQH